MEVDDTSAAPAVASGQTSPCCTTPLTYVSDDAAAPLWRPAPSPPAAAVAHDVMSDVTRALAAAVAAAHARAVVHVHGPPGSGKRTLAVTSSPGCGGGDVAVVSVAGEAYSGLWRAAGRRERREAVQRALEAVSAAAGGACAAVVLCDCEALGARARAAAVEFLAGVLRRHPRAALYVLGTRASMPAAEEAAEAAGAAFVCCSPAPLGRAALRETALAWLDLPAGTYARARAARALACLQGGPAALPALWLRALHDVAGGADRADCDCDQYFAYATATALEQYAAAMRARCAEPELVALRLLVALLCPDALGGGVVVGRALVRRLYPAPLRRLVPPPDDDAAAPDVTDAGDNALDDAAEWGDDEGEAPLAALPASEWTAAVLDAACDAGLVRHTLAVLRVRDVAGPSASGPGASSARMETYYVAPQCAPAAQGVLAALVGRALPFVRDLSRAAECFRGVPCRWARAGLLELLRGPDSPLVAAVAAALGCCCASAAAASAPSRVAPAQCVAPGADDDDDDGALYVCAQGLVAATGVHAFARLAGRRVAWRFSGERLGPAEARGIAQLMAQASGMTCVYVAMDGWAPDGQPAAAAVAVEQADAATWVVDARLVFAGDDAAPSPYHVMAAQDPLAAARLLATSPLLRSHKRRSSLGLGGGSAGEPLGGGAEGPWGAKRARAPTPPPLRVPPSGVQTTRAVRLWVVDGSSAGSAGPVFLGRVRYAEEDTLGTVCLRALLNCARSGSAACFARVRERNWAACEVTQVDLYQRAAFLLAGGYDLAITEPVANSAACTFVAGGGGWAECEVQGCSSTAADYP
eukprot:m51a1_g1024 hypothetical protein (815) ;mRNA; f:648200-650644